MGSRPLSTTLLTALFLWALWLWERHQLSKISPAPPAGPSGPLQWPAPPGPVPLPRRQGGAAPELSPENPWLYGVPSWPAALGGPS